MKGQGSEYLHRRYRYICSVACRHNTYVYNSILLYSPHPPILVQHHSINRYLMPDTCTSTCKYLLESASCFPAPKVQYSRYSTIPTVQTPLPRAALEAAISVLKPSETWPSQHHGEKAYIYIIQSTLEERERREYKTTFRTLGKHIGLYSRVFTRYHALYSSTYALGTHWVEGSHRSIHNPFLDVAYIRYLIRPSVEKLYLYIPTYLLLFEHDLH